MRKREKIECWNMRSLSCAVVGWVAQSSREASIVNEFALEVSQRSERTDQRVRYQSIWFRNEVACVVGVAAWKNRWMELCLAEGATRGVVTRILAD